ncbi:hypothetical protein ACWGH2_01695 [Streptomyces sp. NPDC054871]
MREANPDFERAVAANDTAALAADGWNGIEHHDQLIEVRADGDAYASR